MNKNDISRYCLTMTIFLFISLSCKKVVEISAPVTNLNADNVYKSDPTAISVLTGIYAKMGTTLSGFTTGNSSIALFSGLSADEFDLYNGVTDVKYIGYYKNALQPNGTIIYGSEFWNPLYSYIYVCNAALEGIDASNELTPLVKQQLLGEAKFIRAFCYFYLVNLFGDVPLIVTSDYARNSTLGRSPKLDIYQQIIDDLISAQALLSENYLNGNLQVYSGTPERVRPNKWAATALLSRVYLYVGDYANAEIQASIIIDQNSSLYNLTSLNQVFLRNSNEAIWQLQPVITGHNTEDGWLFIIPSTGPTSTTNSSTSHPVYLSQTLLNSFELNDQRKMNINWVKGVTVSGVTYYYPYKYKSATLNASVTEYLMVLRLAEQFLIRAEARNHLGKLSGSVADLNAIRNRAGLNNYSLTTQSDLLKAILHEKQVELFTEWGHRWLDLKRAGLVDSNMNTITPQKGGNWKSSWQWYPLPLIDIQRDPSLTQNSDY